MSNNRKQTDGRKKASAQHKAQTIRLGNFRVRLKDKEIEASDFLEQWRLSTGRLTPLGLNIAMLALENKTVADIYIKLLWAIGNIAPDTQYLTDLWNAYQQRLSRMPKEEDTDDATEIEDMKRLEAFLQMDEEQMNKELAELKEAQEEIQKQTDNGTGVEQGEAKD